MRERYTVQTEHIRGERRIYWVEDLQRKYGRGYEQVTPHTASERKAQGWCDKLNAGSSAHPLQHHGEGQS